MSASSRKPLAAFVTLALAASLIAGAGPAHAAKVTETAPGGVVPNATGGGGLAVSRGVLTQTMRLKGSKVNKRQTLDVNLTVTGFGSAIGAADEIFFKLIAPSGDNVTLDLIPDVSSFLSVQFDDESDLIFCNPLAVIADNCNYIVGATTATTDPGYVTGPVHASLNPFFEGLNPKGTWTLKAYDRVPFSGGIARTTLLGESVLEVKTGKRFAKE